MSEQFTPLRAFLNGFADDSLEQARKIKIWREGLLGNLDEVNRVQADLEYQKQLARQLKEANPTAFPAGQSLSGTLDRLEITTTGGTNTFDAGLIGVSYKAHG